MVRNIIDEKLRLILDGVYLLHIAVSLMICIIFFLYLDTVKLLRKGYSKVVWLLVSLELCYCIFVLFFFV